MADDLLAVAPAVSKNPLDYYRSYNYIFTLAALGADALTDPMGFRESASYYVIARSGGKGTVGLSRPNPNVTSTSGNTLAEDTALVDSFNQNSPGRFDFSINNVSIETIMSGGQDTGMSVATKLSFEILEPYSMTGFIEALQVSAVASGHAQYIECPYLLKMEFVGYPDSEELPETAQPVPNSSRYFVFNFTTIDIDVTENGARYQCTGIPSNEAGFGDPSTMKASIQIKGNTVGTILQSYQDAINEAVKSNADAAKDTKKQLNCDKYEIFLAKVDDKKGITKERDTSWDNVKVTELLKDNAVYKFPDPGGNTATTTIRYSPTESVVHFAENSKIPECIMSIIRDSEYTKNIIKDLKPDATGMVDYFMVHLEVEKQDTHDTATNKAFYLYRYVVIPYKIHYSRLPLTLKTTVDTAALTTRAVRQYEYLYTGKNTNILKFNLKFNSLFFQAIPQALGNTKDLPSQRNTLQPGDYSQTKLQNKPENEIQQTETGASTIREAPNFAVVNAGGLANSGQKSSDPYAALAKSMHQAILDNVDQCIAEMDIVGDPFYLVTGGVGNYRPEPNPDGTVGEGEAAFTTEDVMIVIRFRNPIDIDMETGQAIFDQKVTPYSGVFRVTQVKNDFKDGQFTQHLNMIRLPAQLVDTNAAPVAVEAVVQSLPDPIQDATPKTPPAPSGMRADPTSLASSILAGLPTPGLPGNLSNLITSGVTSLANGATAAAAAAVSWGTTALSAGVSGASNLVSTIGASAPDLTSTLGTRAVSAVNSLGGGADLLSGASAKIAGLTSADASIAGSLGVDTSSLSGLSSNLQSKVSAQISETLAIIPDSVDVTAAVKGGLLLNNIPKTALANIPSTQPFHLAPPPIANLKDIKAILDKGGSLANIPGASSIPGVDKLLAASGNINFPSGLGLDASSIAGKLSTVQSGIGGLTGQIPSVEAGLNSISSMVPSGIPNVASVESSVASQFGSVSSAVPSPLSTLMKSYT